MQLDLGDLSFDNIGDWPLPVRVGALVLIGVLLLITSYWFDAQHQIQTLDKAKKAEVSLRQSFEKKQQQAMNLSAYNAQLQQMREKFGEMINQLPSRAEIPGLLEDISRTGVECGLEFTLFDPLTEVGHDFYAELPIRVEVIGTYHQLAIFISRISGLDRIVTLHDLDIEPLPRTEPGLAKVKSSQLKMAITAKIYRYSGRR